ncbi:Oligoribonuclease NrnB or cAMP/cGMP phosphodiesterase, DHH superfamily [Halorubrum ezzemoulense]|uniref:Oligoribonuclease NrnB or cAMP/cGMP phosphodiesterase, DHH superfamily n=1 Tax=Halorubrum ezzemoulense TaxID=337243 RepID=A0A238WJR3_HALEZ|nr:MULTISPECIES: phosphohydrolase [Halorubrum]MDB9279818.1 phosphohydrolase [Halorubrum ezzemoulense]MDB9283227.1 phosphohydrolase [Halorubrum ezzemoulense]OYR62315.1 phosphohydrolase [Halorubrum ezzemoulense]TKX40700.1 phosphohydrolase [Halorubrum sp. CGM4_25_10-8A]TKX67208.1 phosphohydrolase [Halorubrum sp. GN12_10-3_MGM]
MDDDLIETGDAPRSRYTKLPGKGFFYPDSLDDERAERRAREAIEGSEAVVIADGDADGLACAAMIREAYDAALDVGPFEDAVAARLEGESGSDEPDEPAADDEGEGDDDPLGDAHAESPVGLVSAGPYSIDTALERVEKYADDGIDLFVCDLCPDDYEWIAEPLTELADSTDAIRWFDHHQWDDETADAVREAGVDLVVGESDEECTADVTLRSLDYAFDDRWAELAEVTRDHDLWLKEDPRSDDLADYSYWAGAEEYAAVVGAYGVDLPEAVRSFVAERRVEKEARIDLAVDRAVTHEVGDWRVAVTYGRCSQNEVAERLREAGADAAVIVKPAGSASIRGSDDFRHAHEVAGRVNGGGHPQAAGCKPDIYDDMLDYAHHWSTEGQACKRVILAAFEAVAEEVEAEASGADEAAAAE